MLKDKRSSVIGLASAGIGIATLIPTITIAPVIAGGAVIAGVSCAVYTG